MIAVGGGIGGLGRGQTGNGFDLGNNNVRVRNEIRVDKYNEIRGADWLLRPGPGRVWTYLGCIAGFPSRLYLFRSVASWVAKKVEENM